MTLDVPQNTAKNAIARRGHSLQWDRDDRDEVREYHRQLRRKRGRMDSARRARSIQRLYDQGYCPTDVSVMIGLSRERVRQINDEYDLRPPRQKGSLPRLWDDDEERFVAVSPEKFGTVCYRAEVRRRRIEREKERFRRRLKHMRAIWKLQSRLGRSPTIGEITDEVGKAWPQVARAWGYRPDGGLSYNQAGDLMYQAAGAEKYDRGEHREHRESG